MIIGPGCPVTGLNRLFVVDDHGRRLIAEVWNTWQYTWGTIVGQALTPGISSPGLNIAYLEYANVVNPTDAVSIPSFKPQDGIEYYAGLAGVSGRDYLRIPIRVTPSLTVAAGYSPTWFGTGQGNLLTLMFQSAGTAGVHGTPFSDSANSKLAGVALVSAPSLGDLSKDVIFARSYYPTDKQVIKPMNGQFAVEYPLLFGGVL